MHLKAGGDPGGASQASRVCLRLPEYVSGFSEVCLRLFQVCLRLFRPLVGNSSQLMIARRSRYDNSCLFALFSRGLGIQCIKDRGANKDGEKEGYHIHTDTKKEGLPAADCVEGCAFHGFRLKMFSKVDYTT